MYIFLLKRGRIIKDVFKEYFFLQERNLLLLHNMGRLQRVPELWRKRKFPKTVRTSKRRVVLPNLLTCPPVRFDRFIDQFLKVRNYNPKYTLLGWKTLTWITNLSREIKNYQICNYIYLSTYNHSYLVGFGLRFTDQLSVILTIVRAIFF